MAEPYESPNNSPQTVADSPHWYVLFYQLSRPAWYIGAALIVCSWFNIVSPTVGWVGFGLAGAVVLGAKIFPSLAGVNPEDHVLLEDRILESKDAAYANAMERFAAGATLEYEGVAFGFRSGNIIACGCVASSANIDIADARELADHAQSVFDTLNTASPEFASAVVGHEFRISIMSSTDADSAEIYRIIDGNIEPRG